MATVADRKQNAEAMMRAAGAPMTAANLLRLARKYETAYRRHRASKYPPTPELLCGEVQTARAFYSLAREATA